MPITRTPMIDDDGSGTTGTILNNAWKQELYNQIDALAGPMGAWLNVPFDPANYFTADAGVNWTVTSGQVQSHKYAIVGSTMHLLISVAGILSGATAGLRIKMPAGYHLTSYAVVPMIWNQGSNTYGYALFNPAFANQIIISQLNNEGWIAGGATVYLNTTLEVVPA